MSALHISRDAILVNAFVNHPGVLPNCGFGGARADVTSRINDDDLVFVTDGEAAMIAFHQHDSEWEKHNLFLPSCRGARAIEMGRTIFGWFTEYAQCDLITAQTPFQNRAARWFNRQIGMVSKGFRNSDLLGLVERFEMECARCR